MVDVCFAGSRGLPFPSNNLIISIRGGDSSRISYVRYKHLQDTEHIFITGTLFHSPHIFIFKSAVS